MQFKDKKVWITGASSGIGEALAYAFNSEGAKLILSARRKEELERVAAACEDTDDRVFILPLDLSKPETFAGATEKAQAHFGGIDILVNNGGVSQRATAMESSMDSFRQIMEINVFGTIGLTKAVLPYMVEQKSGHIVVISSVMGKIGTKFRSGYAASKHALHGWFDCLRQEMYEHSIDVTLVCPGYVKTNITKNALTADGTAFGKMGDAHSTAMTTDRFTKILLPKIARKKEEVYIGGKEVLTVYLKRFFPRLLNRILRNVKVT